MPIGYISYLNTSGNYGFIDCPELNLDHIYFHYTNCSKTYKNIYKGDKVTFESECDDTNGVIPKKIAFVKNATLDVLKNDFENGTHLKGYLKKIENKYYVKDLTNYMFIQLVLIDHEINLKEVYDDHLNELIDYKIVMFTENNKIRAINLKRQFSPDRNLLFIGNQMSGLVVAVVKGGFQLKVYDNIIGFLPLSFTITSGQNIEVGSKVEVTCIKSNTDIDNYIFNLTANLQNQYSDVERQKFITNLQINDYFVGKVISVVGFGLFINIGPCDGLLHLNNILKNKEYLLKYHPKELNKLLESSFKKGQELEVIIEDILNGRISFTLDSSLDINKNALHKFLSYFE